MFSPRFLLPQFLALSLAGSAALAAPIPIIFDTDMDTDCDDAGALAVLHALADRGECQILATIVSTRHPGAAPTVQAINAYYGRPELPIAAVREGGVHERSLFAGQVAAEFPESLKSTADAPDAASLYRDLLERHPDGSVVVVTVGYLTNLRHLLELPAEGERMGGRDLAARKVNTYVCMGGNFVGAPPKDDLKLGNVNFQRDARSAHFVIQHWPGPIVFVGREIGSVPSGLRLGASLAWTPKTNPVRRAYEHYFGGVAKDRHVADLVTVLYAVRGLRDYWDIETRGYMDLRADMTFEWRYDRDAEQSFLRKKPGGGTQDRYIERVLDELLIQPPTPQQGSR
jgi:hypothetical protein